MHMSIEMDCDSLDMLWSEADSFTKVLQADLGQSLLQLSGRVGYRLHRVLLPNLFSGAWSISRDEMIDKYRSCEFGRRNERRKVAV